MTKAVRMGMRAEALAFLLHQLLGDKEEPIDSLPPIGSGFFDSIFPGLSTPCRERAASQKEITAMLKRQRV
jgi:hypothetical protein